MKSMDFAVSPQWEWATKALGFQQTINLYPPYVGAGIHVSATDPDFYWIETQLDMHFWNRNYVGTHFGGSLYSMCDPFYMFILLHHLGAQDYIIWDKSARIDFVKPGTGTVRARFEIDAETLDAIRAKVAKDRKTDWEFETTIRNEDDEIVARVYKTLYIRRAPGKR